MADRPDPLVRDILALFDLSPEDEAWVLAPDPAVDARRDRERRYLESLPRRQRDAAAEVNRRYAHLLPEGMRFEWGNSA